MEDMVELLRLRPSPAWLDRKPPVMQGPRGDTAFSRAGAINLFQTLYPFLKINLDMPLTPPP